MNIKGFWIIKLTNLYKKRNDRCADEQDAADADANVKKQKSTQGPKKSKKGDSDDGSESGSDDDSGDDDDSGIDDDSNTDLSDMG